MGLDRAIPEAVEAAALPPAESWPWGVAVAAVAAAYFVTGRLGLALAIPPGYATAVWPPSGIALAAVLLAGTRVWPGILLGSFLVNISTGFDAGTADALVRSLAVPAAIAGGAALQAVAGGILARRFGGFPNPLRTLPQIAGLLGLGGAAACVVNASVGVVALAAAGRVPPAGLPFTWMTWWGGDTIGVFVFTPLVLALLMRPRALWRRRTAILFTATAATFAAGVGLVAYTSHLERRTLDAQLADRGDDLGAALEMTVAARLQAVDALQAFLSPSDDVGAGAFARFSADLRSHIPGVLALEWVPRVTADQRPAFEAWARGQGLAGFRITEDSPAGLGPAAARPEYFPVTFVEPMAGNERALGLDLGSYADRRAMLALARATGGIAVTGRITLVQGGRAVLAAIPVRRGAATGDRPGERFAGFALGVLRLADLTRTAFHRRDVSDVHYWLMDQTDPGAPVALSADTDEAPAAFRLVEHGLFGDSGALGYQRAFDVGGRRWVLQVAPTQVFIAEHRPQNAWFALVGGLLATALVGAFAMVVTGREGELLGLVEARTADLRRSEESLVTAQRIAHLGSWNLDLTTNVLTWSEEIYRIFGIDREQFGASYEAFMESVHPDDRAYVDRKYREALEGKQPYDIDHRIIRRDDGAVRWVHETCEHVRNEAGEIVRSDGTVHDITDRRRLEAERRRLVMAVEQSPASVVITDPAGTIEYVNPAFSRVTGYSFAEALGQNPRILKSGETSLEEYGAMWDDLTHGRSWTGLFHNRRKDGSLYWEQAQISPVVDDSGRITSYLALKEDITARKAAEAALKASEQQLRATFDQAAIGFIHTSFEGTLLACNKRYCDIIGYPPDEVAGLTWQAITHPDDIGPSTAQAARMLLGDAETASWEKRYIRKDGRTVWVRVTSSVQRDECGRPLHFITAVEDIDRQKAAEAGLRAVTARLKLVLDTTAEGIVGIDDECRIVLANRAAAEALGWPSAEAMVGRSSEDAFGHALADGARCGEGTCAIRLALKDGETRRVADEYFGNAATAARVPVEYVVSPLVVEGERVGAVIAFHDISDRRRLEEEVRQSEQRFRLLFDSGNDFVWLHAVDPATGAPVGHFIEVNDAACRRLGYSRDEMLHLGPYDIDDPSTPTVDDKVMSLAHRDWAVFERVHVAKDGRRIPVEVNARKIVYRGQTLLLAICRDITKRRALEEDLRRSNTELEQFAYVASHDLRQPLRMVTSYLSLIERRLADRLDDETGQFMAFARDGAKKMDHLILDLLDYSRVGRHGAPMADLPLADVVAEAVANLGMAIAEAKAAVTVQPDLPVVAGRRSDLVRLFQNLIGNGVKYRAADRAPTVAVTCRRERSEWMVSVRDNGIGVPADQADRIFGVFQRLHTSDQYEGTGIGLAICRKVVEHHGGRIWVEPADGAGSDFRFTLPADAPPPSSDGARTPG